MPMARLASVLPAPTFTVAAGLSRPYSFRSAASCAAIVFIGVEFSRPRMPSIAPKSARPSNGAVIRQSLPCFDTLTAWSGVAISSRSTFSRSNFRIVLSRRSNIDLLNVESRYDGIRKTRGFSGSFA